MKILDRYIFREILYPSLIALVALTFVAFLAFSREIGWLFELIVRQAATVSQISKISVAILPNVLTFTIPMAVLVGILTGFGRMSSDSEAIAFRASGISMIRLLVPVMLLGTIAWAGSLTINVWLAPERASHLRELRYQIAAKQVSLEIKPRVFNENLTNLVLYVQNSAREAFRWDGIMLADMTHPDQPSVTFARSGNLVKDEENHTFVLTLTNGSTHAFSPFLGAWLPNLVFAVVGIALLARSNREYENPVLSRLAAVIRWFSDTRAAMRTSPKRWNRWTYSLTHHPKFFRLLDVYVLRGFWFFFVLVLIAFVSVFILVTLFELLPDIVKNRVDTVIVVTYFVYLLPQILYYVIPLTVLLAILINLGTLTKTNEILAVKAGAVSLYRMAMPLLIMGFLLSAGIYFLQDFMLPYANQKQDEYHDVIKGRAPQTYRDPQRKWMAGSGERIYHYNYFDPDQDVFGGISIFGFKPNSFELTEWMFATRATWDGAMWKFEDGWTRRIGTGGSVDYQPFTSLEVRELDRPDYFKKEVRTAAQMTYPELKRYVTSLKQSGFDVSGLMVDLYRKLSFPLVSFIMAIIGIPFSFTTGRKGAFYGIGLSVAVGIFYWSTFAFFDKLGGINRLSPFVAAWFPNLIFGFSGIWMMLRVKT